MQHRPLVPEDTLNDVEYALNAFARLARAMARGDADAPRIAVMLVFEAQTGRRRRRATQSRAGKQAAPPARD